MKRRNRLEILKAVLIASKTFVNRLDPEERRTCRKKKRRKKYSEYKLTDKVFKKDFLRLREEERQNKFHHFIWMS